MKTYLIILGEVIIAQIREKDNEFMVTVEKLGFPEGSTLFSSLYDAVEYIKNLLPENCRKEIFVKF